MTDSILAGFAAFCFLANAGFHALEFRATRHRGVIFVIIAWAAQALRLGLLANVPVFGLVPAALCSVVTTAAILAALLAIEPRPIPHGWRTAALALAAACAAATLALWRSPLAPLPAHLLATVCLLTAAPIVAERSASLAQKIILGGLLVPWAAVLTIFPLLALDGVSAKSLLATEFAAITPALVALATTRSRLAGAATRAATAKLDAIFHDHAVPFLLVEPESGRIVETNQAAADFYGYSREDLRRLNVSQLNVMPETKLRELRRQALERTKGCFSFVHLLRSGEPRNVEVYSCPAPQPNGKTLLFSIIHDVTDRLRAEESLARERANERRFTALVMTMTNNMHDLLWATDLQGRCVFANRAFAEVMGSSQGEVLGAPPHVPLARFDAPENSEMALESRSCTWAGTLRGVFRAFEVDETPLLADDGSRLGCVGSARDITKRLMAEQALRASESRYRTLVETASEGIWAFDAEGCATYVNQATCRLLDCRAEDLLGRPKTDFLFAEDMAAYAARRPVSAAIDRYELRLRGKNGAERWALVSEAALPREANRPSERLAMLIDISDYKRIQRLQEARGELTSLSEAGDIDKTMQVALDRAEALTQSAIGFFHFVEGERLVLRCWSTRTLETCTASAKGSHYPTWRAGVWADAVRRDEVVIHNDYAALPGRRSLPEGHVPLSRELVAPVHSQGRLVAVIGVGNKPCDYDQRDVESLTTLGGLAWEAVIRMRAKQSLERGLRLAEEAGRIKSEFLANMSHEIRTPLHGVIGMLQLISFGPASEEQSTYCSMALTSAKRLLALLDDLLDFTQLEAGRVRINAARLNLADIVQGAVDVFGIQCAEKDLRLEHELFLDESRPVFGDAGRIRSLINNVVGNAVKYTPAGSVRLSLWLRSLDPPRLYIAVADTGVGIRDEDLPVIFQRFSRGQSAGLRGVRGVGLGLAVVKAMVDLMDGTICVSSSPDAGTTVVLWLPLTTRGQCAGLAAPEAGGTGIGILVVGDDAAARQAMCRYLQSLGHRTEDTDAGAIGILKAHPLDCVLLDVAAPEAQSLALLESIRSARDLGFTSRIPVIALIPEAAAGLAARFQAAGADVCLAKPVQFDELMRAVEGVTAPPAKD
jgi:PAS domain S-box-containing protein